MVTIFLPFTWSIAQISEALCVWSRYACITFYNMSKVSLEIVSGTKENPSARVMLAEGWSWLKFWQNTVWLFLHLPLWKIWEESLGVPMRRGKAVLTWSRTSRSWSLTRRLTCPQIVKTIYQSVEFLQIALSRQQPVLQFCQCCYRKTIHVVKKVPSLKVVWSVPCQNGLLQPTWGNELDPKALYSDDHFWRNTQSHSWLRNYPQMNSSEEVFRMTGSSVTTSEVVLKKTP